MKSGINRYLSYLNFAKFLQVLLLANPRFIILNLYMCIFPGFVPSNEAKEEDAFPN